MKKFLMAIFALAVATTVASAAVGINWTAGTWGYANDGVTPILDNNSVLWQLIYAGADNTIDPLDSSNVAGNYVSDDDAVWAERTIVQGGGVAPEDNSNWDNWLMPTGYDPDLYTSGWSTAGFVYQRVFESSMPINGTMYWESELTALNIAYVSTDPTSITQSYADRTGDGFTPNQTFDVIPEPATMGLLGLGALVMAIRRRRS